MPKDLIKKLIIERIKELEESLTNELVTILSGYVVNIILPEVKKRYPHENILKAHEQALNELEKEGFEIIGAQDLNMYIIKTKKQD